jgi:hypothetical protein
MEDRLVRPTMRRMNPESRYAAYRVGFKSHVITRQDTLHHGIEWLACFDSSQNAFHGTRHRLSRGNDRAIFRVKRVRYDVFSQRAFSRRMSHGQLILNG